MEINAWAAIYKNVPSVSLAIFSIREEGIAVKISSKMFLVAYNIKTTVPSHVLNVIMAMSILGAFALDFPVVSRIVITALEEKFAVFVLKGTILILKQTNAKKLKYKEKIVPKTA